MSKKLILVLAAVIFFSKFGLVSASDVVINEFVSDPDSGSEWIELRNTSSATVDLSGWSWTELASPGGDTEHESSPKNLSGSISADGFFVVEMSSALNNTGDSIGLYEGSNIQDRVTFGKVNGYAKDLEVPTKGKSGALISGNWETDQEPTKNAANSASSSNNNESENNEEESETPSSGSSSSSRSSTNTATVSAKIKAEIIASNIAYAGIPLEFQGRATRGGQQVYNGKYFWNFGDGDFREVKTINADKFTHTYFYPGEYSVLFEYYPNFFAEVPDAFDKITIKVLEPSVVISSVGSVSDFFIELNNQTNYAADISGWILAGANKSFVLPRHTTLSAKQKMMLSPRLTNFSISDKNFLQLLTPTGELAFNYSFPKPIARSSVSRSPSPVSPSLPLLNSSNPISQNLSAASANSGIFEPETQNSSFSPLIPILFLALVVVSALAVYFIRQKNIFSESGLSTQTGQDFEILDE
jgi:hypothetical protein